MNTSKRTIQKSSVLCEEYQKVIHPSGLEIYVFPKKFTSYYAILGVRYGAIHNELCVNGERVCVPDGIAHFLEHKLFANEDGHDSFEVFSKHGADANAYTSFGETAYLFSCTENFYPSLDELLHFVTHPFFTKENVDSEIGIISEEIKMYDDNPNDRCYYGMLEGMYAHHPVKRNICGSCESIRKITPELLYACYDSYYSLSNMVLVLCGDIDADEAISFVDSRLPKKSAKSVHKTEFQPEPTSAVFPLVETQMQVSKPIFCIGIKDTAIPRSAAQRAKRDTAMNILNEMIFTSAGELYNTLFDARLISPNLSSGYSISPTFAYSSISGESDEPKKVLEEILKYVKKLKQTGLSRDDFLRAKRVAYADFVRAFDSTDFIATNLFSIACEGGDIFDSLSAIDSLTFEDVSALLEDTFDEQKITLSIIYPINDKKRKGEQK